MIPLRLPLAVLALTCWLPSCSFSVECPSPREPQGAGCVCPEGWGDVAEECVAPTAADPARPARASDAMSAPMAERSRLDAGLDLDAEGAQDDAPACPGDGGCPDGGLGADAAATS